MRISSILVLTVALMLLAAPAFAPPLPTLGSERYPSSAYDPVNDRYLVVFQETTAIGLDIYGRFMDSDGQPDGADFAISDQINAQSTPDVTYNSDNGNFLVVWEDGRNADTDIYGQFINATSGALIDYASDVNFAVAIVAGNQFSPTVASNAGANRVLVTWYDYRNGNYDIYGQFVNSLDGSHLFNTVGQNFIISNAASSVKYNPDVSYDSTGDRFLVAWQDSRNVASDIYGQFVNSVDGSLIFNTMDQNFIISNATTDQYNSAVSYDATGNRFLVVWLDYRDANYNIYGQLVDATDGSLLVSISNTNIALSTESSSQYAPAVASTGYGSYLVVWDDDRNATQQIYGEAVDASDGSLLSGSSNTNFQVMTNSDDLNQPALSHDPGNDTFLVVAHSSDGSDNFAIESTVYPEADGGGGGGGDDDDGGGGGGGCFIATAAYGSYSDSNVMALRKFRDEHMMTNALGRKLVDTYYAYSPPIAGYIAEHPAIRASVRLALAPVVYGVQHPMLLGFVFTATVIGAGAGFRRRKKNRS